MANEKKYLKPVHPGEILLEDFMKPLNLSQNRLAREIGVPPRRINEIIHGKRAITADTAISVDEAFDKGADDCIFKPLNFKETITRIRKLLK